MEKTLVHCVSRRLGAALLGAALAASAALAEPREPSCVVTYSVSSSRTIDVTSAVCDDPSLEDAAMVFAFVQLEGPFREMLVMQARSKSSSPFPKP